MENMEKIKSITNMLKIFISGNDRSIKIAEAIEVELDSLFPDDYEIQEFVTCFASYRPSGGEYLYDENDIIGFCKEILNIFQSKYDIN